MKMTQEEIQERAHEAALNSPTTDVTKQLKNAIDQETGKPPNGCCSYGYCTVNTICQG